MEKLPELYEKLYFHEIDAREEVNSRLQMPLTLIIALAGVFAYLLQSFDRSLANVASYLFVGFLALTGVALLAGVYFFVRAAWGVTYSFVPYAQDTDAYHAKLNATYDAYDRANGTKLAEKYLDEYVKNYFVAASTANGKINDQRSIHLQKANMFLIVTAALAVFAFGSFVFGDLDRASKKLPLEVLLTRPVEVHGVTIPQKFVLVPSPVSDQVTTQPHDDSVQAPTRLAPRRIPRQEQTLDKSKGSTGNAAAATSSPNAPDASDQRGRSDRRTTAPAETSK